MNKALMAELEKLGPDERFRLAYDLLDSVAQAESTAPVTEPSEPSSADGSTSTAPTQLNLS